MRGGSGIGFRARITMTAVVTAALASVSWWVVWAAGGGQTAALAVAGIAAATAVTLGSVWASRAPGPANARAAPPAGSTAALPVLPGPSSQARLPPPAPPIGAVPRPRLAAMTLSALHDGLAPLVALTGGPGFGKSVLARQVAADVDTQAAPRAGDGGEGWRPGGVVWLDIGQDPDLASLLAQCLTDLTGVPGSGRSAEKLASDLGAHLAAHRCLLVLDDVWPPCPGKDDEVLGIIFSRIGNVPRLVTTRSAALLDAVPGARCIDVTEMEPGEAAAVLAAALRGQASEQVMVKLGEFARKLGCWPLLLGLAAAYLRRRVYHGMPLDEAFGHLIDCYKEKYVTAFDPPDAVDPRDPDQRNRAVAATVEASLRLSPEGQTHYPDLAVFPPGQPIPVDVIADLWAPALDKDGTDELLITLADLALLTLDLKTRYVRMHDLLRAYLLPANADQVAALHRRLLQGWGDAMLQDRYRTRWYAYHLDMADDTDGLYALITPPWRDRVLAVTGALSDVEADVRRAAEHASRRHDLPEELRCRLITTSLAEYAKAVPRPLFPAFARLGQLDRALGFATLLPSFERDQALFDVAAVLAKTDADQALAVADLIGRPLFRGRALADVAITLADTDPDQALAIVGRIGDPMLRDQALAELAVATAAALAATDPDRALTVADRVGAPWAKERVLAATAAALAGTDPDRALLAARSIGDPVAKTQTLTTIAAALARTDPGRAHGLVDEAVVAFGDIDDPAAKAQELARMGAALADADPARVSALAEAARAAADGIDDDGAKNRALIDIANALASTDPDQALATASRINDLAAEARAIAGIAAVIASANPGRASKLTDQALAAADSIGPGATMGLLIDFPGARARTDPDQALAVADRIEDPGTKVRALADFAAALASTDPDQALKVADHIDERWFKAEAIANVAAAVADTDPGRFRELADQAVATASRSDAPWYQAIVLGAFAVVLASTDLDLALAATDRIDSPETKAQVLGDIAATLAPADPDQALAIVDRIGDPVVKALTLTGIAAALASTDLDLALATTDRIDDRTRGQALAGIAAMLATADPDQAVATADRIDNPLNKAQARASIAAAVAAADPGRASGLVGQALDAASHIDLYPEYQAQALIEIAAELTAADPGRASGLVDQALAAADQLDEPAKKAQALVGIAAALTSHGAPLAGQAVDAADHIEDPFCKAWALTGIAAALAAADPGRASGLVGQALDVADRLDDLEHKAQALVGIAAALAGIEPGRAAPLARQVVDAADHINNHDYKAWTLTGITATLAGTNPDLALATAGRIDDPNYKAQVLGHLAAALAGTNPSRARGLAEQAMAAADQVDLGSKAQALADIAVTLAEEDPGLALAAVDHIDDEERKAYALANVATVRADRARTVDTAGDRQPDIGITDDIMTRLRGIDPAVSKEAWWRFAQLAVTLAASAPERHDLVQAALAAEW